MSIYSMKWGLSSNSAKVTFITDFHKLNDYLFVFVTLIDWKMYLCPLKIL